MIVDDGRPFVLIITEPVVVFVIVVGDGFDNAGELILVPGEFVDKPDDLLFMDP